MPSDDRPTPREASGESVVYQQGKRKVAVKPLSDALAARYRSGMEEAASEALRSVGRVQPVKSQRLFVVELPEGPRREAAMKALQKLVDEGVLEFAAPVLRDDESQLQQILTDEITVRFQSDPSPERLQRLEEQHGLTVDRRNEFVPRQFIMKVKRPIGLHPLEIASELDAEEGVEFAAPNFISEFHR